MPVAPVELVNPMRLPLEELVPLPVQFSQRSTLHGQQHVARVMVHAFLLLELTGQQAIASQVWASVYLHDLGRVHDGVAPEHGADALAKLEGLKPFFARAGLTGADYGPIETAVKHHSLGAELNGKHPHRPLTALLKDADGLDRVRLGDLAYLRYPESSVLAPFAQDLYHQTFSKFKEGPDYFPQLWEEAQRLWQ